MSEGITLSLDHIDDHQMQKLILDLASFSLKALLQNVETQLGGLSPDCVPIDTCDRYSPKPLSEAEILLLKLFLHRNQERKKLSNSAILRACINGIEYSRWPQSQDFSDRFEIPITTTYIEVFGQDDEGEQLLDVFTLSALDESEHGQDQLSRTFCEIGSTVDLIVSPSQDNNGNIKDIFLQIRYKGSAVGDSSPDATSLVGEAIQESELLTLLLSAIYKRVDLQRFQVWFSSLSYVMKDDSTIYLKAPNIVVRDWVSTNYDELIKEALRELKLDDYKVDFLVDEDDLSESNINVPANGNSKVSNLLTLLEAAESDGLTPAATTFVDIEPTELSLNPKYTFQTFVVGSCNQFAHAAALAVAEAPGKTYNPLYIYGGVGLGKTHLMHAAGHAIKELNRHLRISFVSAEKFMNELINAIRYDKAQTFREKYRSVDVLLMDDIQFMAGKERTQVEFFHTFNALYDSYKQIIITSDCPPRGIPTLEERLHSRFEWGLIADMEPPDLETKVAILKRKADLDGVQLPDDVAFFIANKVKSNIRELEGSLVRLVAISSLRGVPISQMLAREAIRSIADDDDDNLSSGISIEEIQDAVARYYGMRIKDLISKNNARVVVLPRQVAMYLCKRLTERSFSEIGREFGNKHHSTVIQAAEKIEELVTKDRSFSKLISSLILVIREDHGPNRASRTA